MDTEARQPRRHSPETRAKISAALTGRSFSPETRAKISAALTGRPGRTGHKHSPETRAKISAALAEISAARKGQKLSAEHRAKISAARKGQKLSAEHRAKLSAAKKGRKLSPEHRAKISEAGKGREQTAATRAKISEANKGRKHSPEHRAKISEAHTGRLVIPRDLADQVKAFLDQQRGARPEPTRSAKTSFPTIRLGEPGAQTFIDGRAVEPLTKSQHAIISKLLASGPEGLTGKEIEERTRFGGWRITLQRLKESHPLWESIIVFPGRPHGRYRLAAIETTA